MVPPVGLTARQAISVSSALTVVLLLPGSALAQDASPAPSPEPAAVEAPRPGRFKPADTPKGKRWQQIGGVVAGGPGYIAVGGGSFDGLDQEALIWVSDDGVRWQSVPLFGEAAKGNIIDIAATPVGYIAVGFDAVPGNFEDLLEALVWRSDDGIVWERISAQDAFIGSNMMDVAATADGAIAVGCLAELQCSMGRAWVTSDGFEWELAGEPPLSVPGSVANNEGTTVIGGVIGGLGSDRAGLISSTDPAAWPPVQLVAKPQSAVSDIAIREGAFVATVSEWLLGADGFNSTLQASPDGQVWKAIESDRFDGLGASAIGSSDTLTVVAGMRGERLRPAILWSHDLERFRNGTFARKPAKSGSELVGATVDGEGGLVFVFGKDRQRPAIWVSRLR